MQGSSAFKLVRSVHVRFAVVEGKGDCALDYDNTDVLTAVAAELSKAFKKKFFKKDFATREGPLNGPPKKMHCSLAQFRKRDGSVNALAVSRIARRAVNVLRQMKGKGLMHLHSPARSMPAAKAEIRVATPPAAIAVSWNEARIRDELGFLFFIKVHA
jgi:hypothetical protein